MTTNTNKQSQVIGLLILSGIIFMIGLAYGFVPLYRLFCQVTGFGGTVQIVQSIPVSLDETSRLITIYFTSDTSIDMPWQFKPIQNEIQVLIGEPALAFYKAANPTDESIVGMATYNVSPPQAGIYFHKIQCFCFEQQRLNAGEAVDMPVFFYIDSSILSDPRLKNLDSITLSYTFFRSED